MLETLINRLSITSAGSSEPPPPLLERSAEWGGSPFGSPFNSTGLFKVCSHFNERIMRTSLVAVSGGEPSARVKLARVTSSLCVHTPHTVTLTKNNYNTPAVTRRDKHLIMSAA